MHSSIWPVTMLAKGIPPEICIFFLSWLSIPQPQARRKRQFPTPGPKGLHLSLALPGGMVTGQIESCITCNPHYKNQLVRNSLAGFYRTMKTGPRASWTGTTWRSLPRILFLSRHVTFSLSWLTRQNTVTWETRPKGLVTLVWVLSHA